MTKILQKGQYVFAYPMGKQTGTRISSTTVQRVTLREAFVRYAVNI